MKINRKIVALLQRGGVGVMPTDTIYGLVGRSDQPKAIERIYHLKKRASSAALIIIIGQTGDLKKLGIKPTPQQMKFVRRVWPGPVSVVFPCASRKFKYLHRGQNSLAVRLPRPRWLKALIKKTGPLVATSANLSGQAPAENILQAKKYFSGDVDFYQAGGKIKKPASTVVDLTVFPPRVIRQGATKIKL